MPNLIDEFIKNGEYDKSINEFLRRNQYKNAVYMALCIKNKSLAIDICLDYRDFDLIRYIQKYH